jgi:hypothetical protein
MKIQIVIENKIKQGLPAESPNVAKVAGSQCRWGYELSSPNASLGHIKPSPSPRSPDARPKLHAHARKWIGPREEQ